MKKSICTAAPLLLLPLAAVVAGSGGDVVDGGTATFTATSQDSPCWVQGDGDTAERPSPLESTSFEFDGGTGTICYGAPSVRERVVFGELVPFGAAWRLGANEATAIHLTGPASIGGVQLEAGSYSIYVTPVAEGDWEFAVNSSVERWGIPINDDVTSANIGTFTATPEATEELVEKMTFSWEPWENERAMGDIVLSWENTRVKFHVHPAG